MKRYSSTPISKECPECKKTFLTKWSANSCSFSCSTKTKWKSYSKEKREQVIAGLRRDMKDESRKERLRLALNKLYRGDTQKNKIDHKADMKYKNLHQWIKKQRGSPDSCEICKKSGLKGHSIHWANKSHEYKRELDDWIRLCVPCHKEFDKIKNI